jgi:hypothetical protein
MVPACQSMSSRLSLATSQVRNPKSNAQRTMASLHIPAIADSDSILMADTIPR